MGCSSTREVIESKMLLLKLRRIEIKKEREDRCKELSKLTGQTIVREPIKDYLIYPDDAQILRQQRRLLNGGKDPEEDLALNRKISPIKEIVTEEQYDAPMRNNNLPRTNTNSNTNLNKMNNRRRKKRRVKKKRNNNNSNNEINDENCDSDHYENENTTFKKDYTRRRNQRIENVGPYNNGRKKDNYDSRRNDNYDEGYDDRYDDRDDYDDYDSRDEYDDEYDSRDNYDDRYDSREQYSEYSDNVNQYSRNERRRDDLYDDYDDNYDDGYSEEDRRGDTYGRRSRRRY